MKITNKFVDDIGAAKFVLTTDDHHKVEASVFTVSDGTENVCVSCQVGCSYVCRHCATGMLGFGRNLTAREMFDQVAACRTAGNVDVLFMGMGEPFANLRRVLQSIDMLVEAGIAANVRHTHIATSGIAGRGWQVLQGLKERPTISVSFHAGTNEARRQIIPHADLMDLAELCRQISEYKRSTGDQVFLNYTPLKGINDSLAEFESFCRYVCELDCVARITPFNSWPSATVSGAETEKAELLEARLRFHKCSYLMRPSQGASVFAGCGQLGARV